MKTREVLEGEFGSRFVHPAATIVPAMGKEDYERLKESIRTQGQCVPIEIYDEMILDGRHRYKACIELCVPPYEVELDESRIPDPVAYVVALNRDRRHLSKSQLAMVGARAKSFYEANAKERQKVRKGNQKGTSPEKLPELSNTGDARDQAGAAVGVSGKSIDAAVEVIENGSPELIHAVEAGDVSVSKAAKLAELPVDEQPIAMAATKRSQSSSSDGKKRDPSALRAIEKRYWELTERQRQNFRERIHVPPHIQRSVSELAGKLDTAINKPDFQVSMASIRVTWREFFEVFIRCIPQPPEGGE